MENILHSSDLSKSIIKKKKKTQKVIKAICNWSEYLYKFRIKELTVAEEKYIYYLILHNLVSN